ncbi:MAG: prepilin-type N-terminal cleavage/methylation domain-containing protein [Desulfobacteraceae bacterium]|nr:prepilin-type N-terminal cleavage/methylation domain-containing protein [Desulfobacteraceae bacterium]
MVHPPIRNIRDTHRELGFSLIEIMIALAVLSIGILGVASMQLSASRGNTSAAKLTFLYTIAADRVEKLMGLPYDAPLLSGTNPHTLAANADMIDNDMDGEIDEGDEVGAPNSAQIHLEWDALEDQDLEDTKTILVRVTQGTGGKRKTAELTYYRCMLN